METTETPGGTTEGTVMFAAPGKDPFGSNPGTTGEYTGDVRSDPRAVTGNAHEERNVTMNASDNAGEAPENAQRMVKVPAGTPGKHAGEAAGSAPAMMDVPTDTNGDPAEQPTAPTMKRTPSQAALGLEAAVHAPENKYASSPHGVRYL